jgi:O-succinylbenzoic acid--CoA ligase
VSCAERRRNVRRFPLEIRAARTPDAPALLWRADVSDPPVSPFAKGETPNTALSCLSYAELEHRTRLAALELLARGLAPGERVALLLQPGPAYPIALLALLRAGCVAVPLSTRMPAETVPALLGRIGCRQLITNGEMPDVTAAGVEITDPGIFRGPGARTHTPSAPLAERGKDAIAQCHRETREGLPAFDPSAPATIVLTSGSTGTPKAALHSFGNHWASAVGANRNLALRPGDRWLLSLPLWHVGGLAVIFRCIQGGAAVALPAAGEPTTDAILALGVTHASLVATQLRRLLGDPGGRDALRSLKAVLLGGGPLPGPLIGEAAALGVRLVASYGSTETASQATATRPGDPPEALRTAGRALRFREVAVDDSGEIVARGRTLFLGYVEDQEIRAVRDEEGWFHTGDLGRLDGTGRLVVEGRRDNMFISGGENIHPEEIERELAAFPGVLETLVVPLPDPEFGARPAAFLRTADGALPEPAVINAFLRRALAGFKVPVRYLAWPNLEEGMKPDRRAFAALVRGLGETGRG